MKKSWLWLESYFHNVLLDEWIIMPDHVHGIIVISDYQSKGGLQSTPTIRKPLGLLITAFKTVSTKQINILYDSPGNQIWQRGFYDRIIRNEDELNKIRNYIKQNPMELH